MRVSAAGGLALFDDQWAVGVWLFSTDMDGTKPYKEIVPISPLDVMDIILLHRRDNAFILDTWTL